MNDEMYPPDAGQGQVSPVEETPQTQVAVQEPPQPPTVPPVAVGAGQQPPKPPKQKINWLWAIIGFFAPTLVLVLVTGVVSWLSSMLTIAPVFGALGGVLQVAVIVGAIVAFVVGSRRGDNRMRSFGIGALWAYVTYTLIALLAFGACLISLGGGGGLFGN